MEGFGEAIKLLCILCFVAGMGTYGLCWYFFQKDEEPTALDVYRGKTELVVTSKNGVPVDSVVVFKNK